MAKLIESILMRLWLVWVAISKKNFICFGYNGVDKNMQPKGTCAFSHLPKDKAEKDLFLDTISEFSQKLKDIKYKSIC